MSILVLQLVKLLADSTYCTHAQGTAKAVISIWI